MIFKKYLWFFQGEIPGKKILIFKIKIDMANDISFESSHRAGYKNIFLNFFGTFWRMYRGSKICVVKYSIRRMMGWREEKWLTGEIGGREVEFFSVSDHAWQTVEELRGEFCILGEILWVDELDPVMDPKQKHASASNFEIWNLKQIASSFELSKFEANLLQILNVWNLK